MLQQLNDYTAQKLYDLAPHLRGRVTFEWFSIYPEYLTLVLWYRAQSFRHSIPIGPDAAPEGVADEALHNTVAGINGKFFA